MHPLTPNKPCFAPKIDLKILMSSKSVSPVLPVGCTFGTALAFVSGISCEIVFQD